MLKLTAFYMILYISFLIFMYNTTTVPFKGYEFDYICILMVITAVFGLFYSFSVLIWRIAEVIDEADKVVEESRRQYD